MPKAPPPTLPPAMPEAAVADDSQQPQSRMTPSVNVSAVPDMLQLALQSTDAENADGGRRVWIPGAARNNAVPEVDTEDMARPDLEIVGYAVAGLAGQGPESDSHSIPGSDSMCHSIAGDSVDPEAAGDADDPAVAEMSRQLRVAPQASVEGHPERGPSSRFNSEPEVGNFGLFFGNWGLRGTLGGASVQRRRTTIEDRQILKNPGQVLILAEATRHVEELLRQPAVAAESPGEGGLQGRSTHEHWVLRGQEESTLLIAARKDNTTGLQLLHFECHEDFPYKEKGKDKIAKSRMMVARVQFKQNIGHLGTDIVVCGVHGHFRTMKMEKPAAWKAFWNRLAQHVREHNVKFIAGDFNMTVTKVPVQLRSRGILCDCVAWYPWQQPRVPFDHSSQGTSMAAVAARQKLGFDSCAIFYIGGGAEVVTPWSLRDVAYLCDVEGDDDYLDVYPGNNPPGQPWTCYRGKRFDETPQEKNLGDRLTELLTLTTTRRELESIRPREGVGYCQYLRLKQKAMDREEWLVDGSVHNGAHFPLCVFTKNASARSATRAKARSRGNQGGKSRSKGGKGSAVAEYGPTYYGKPVTEGKGKREMANHGYRSFSDASTVASWGDNRWGGWGGGWR